VSTQRKREVSWASIKKNYATGSCVQYNNVFQVASNWKARTSTCGAEILDFLETLFFMVKRG